MYMVEYPYNVPAHRYFPFYFLCFLIFFFYVCSQIRDGIIKAPLYYAHAHAWVTDLYRKTFRRRHQQKHLKYLFSSRTKYMRTLYHLYLYFRNNLRYVARRRHKSKTVKCERSNGQSERKAPENLRQKKKWY